MFLVFRHFGRFEASSFPIGLIRSAYFSNVFCHLGRKIIECPDCQISLFETSDISFCGLLVRNLIAKLIKFAEI